MAILFNPTTELKQADCELTYQVMMTAYGLQKDPKSLQTCWGLSGGFAETALLSEKVGFNKCLILADKPVLTMNYFSIVANGSSLRNF